MKLESCLKLIIFLEKINSENKQGLPFQINSTFLSLSETKPENPAKPKGFVDLFEKMKSLNVPTPQVESESKEEKNPFVYTENSWVNNLNEFNRYDNYPLHEDESIRQFRETKQVHFHEPDDSGPFANKLIKRPEKKLEVSKKVSFLQFLNTESLNGFLFENDDQDKFQVEENEPEFGFLSSKSPNQCFLENLLDENDEK